MGFDVAIIGGTGIGSRLASNPGTPVHIPTPYGQCVGRALDGLDSKVLVVQRHARGHRLPPHRVNYRAIASALQRVGVRACVSTAAVGSLREDWGPGTLANCSDFLDLTGRRLTIFHDVVQHTGFRFPFDRTARDAIERASEQVLTLDERHRWRDLAVYVCGDGPRYETPAEIAAMRRLGGDIVGMTAASEAILMREAGIAYGCLAVVTNFGTGLVPGEPSHSEVVDLMREAGGRVVDILMRAATILGETICP